LTRLNNLGVFKSVNISYIKSLTDSLAHLLDVNMDLLMADNINLAFEADLPTKSSGYIDQSGDIKLESNLEFRFDMSKMLKGALFIETGNIWLVMKMKTGLVQNSIKIHFTISLLLTQVSD
jgi:outer membrane protein assembly factor BamA